MQNSESFLDNTCTDRVKKWISEAVVGLNLCPFAKPYTLNESIKIFESSQSEIEGSLEELFKYMEEMSVTSISDTSNVLVVYPKSFNSFTEFLDLINVSTEVLAQSPLVEDFQLAYFHPEFQFDENNKNDRENYTARSPYPIMHILRSELVESARKTFPGVDKIPDTNVRTVMDLTKRDLLKIFTQK